jgi:DNA-binding NtrC family response regulator
MKTAGPLVPNILVADDQPDLLEAMRLLLKGEGFRSECAGSPAAVLDAVAARPFDAILIDLNYTRDTTSGREGLDLLSQLQALDSSMPVIVMTAWGTIELAVEAMRRGARDFVQKPWDNVRLVQILRTQIELSRALRRGERLEAENELLRRGEQHEMVAVSPAMRPVLEIIERVGPSDANVLITGENGTGKGVVARMLHHVSPRAAKPLVTVNMGGLSDALFESELFGHVKGAFTDAKADRVGRFELAEGGTLFLDEIANVPLALQAKLLRVLESNQFERVGSSRTMRADVRMVSATNSDLDVEVESGRFRRDLLFRLNTIEIHIPPLRERREDIPHLAALFLQRYAAHYRKSLSGFDEPAMQLMIDYPWPGNVRELDHTVERSVLMARGATVAASDLGLRSARDGARNLDDMSLEEVECYLIRRTLARFNGNVSKASEALGLSRSGLYRRLSKYGM